MAEILSGLNTDHEETNKKSRSSRKRVILSPCEETSDDELNTKKPFPKVPHKINCVKVDLSKQKSCTFTETETEQSISGPSGLGGIPEDLRAVQPVRDCCRCCKFDKEYKKKIQTDFDEVKNHLKLILQILGEPNRPTNSNETTEMFEDLEHTLPIKTEEEVLIWERHLSTREEQKRMISFLAHIGGHELSTIVKNMLRKIFSDSIASLYNWEGKKKKKMFSSLILADCIKKAAALNAKGTEQEIITVIKNWLRHAAARLNNSNQNQNRECDPPKEH